MKTVVSQADQPNQLVSDIAQRFDDVLRTGVYDSLFLGDPIAGAKAGITGIETFTNLSQEHTEEPVQYEQIPPKIAPMGRSMAHLVAAA